VQFRGKAALSPRNDKAATFANNALNSLECTFVGVRQRMRSIALSGPRAIPLEIKRRAQWHEPCHS